MIRARFHNGRANSYLLKLTVNGAPIDPATTTKIAFQWRAFGAIPAGSVDSDTNPAGFAREATGWRINLGALNLTPGVYKMALIVFTASYPEGKVFSSFDRTTIEIVAA